LKRRVEEEMRKLKKDLSSSGSMDRDSDEVDFNQVSGAKPTSDKKKSSGYDYFLKK